MCLACGCVQNSISQSLSMQYNFQNIQKYLEGIRHTFCIYIRKTINTTFILISGAL